MRNALITRIVILSLIVISAILIYNTSPSIQAFVTQVLGSARNPAELKELISSYKSYAPLIILLLTCLQAVITIMPLAFVMMASTMVFGLFWGVVISLVSQVIAGYAAMRFTKYFGRPFVEEFVPAAKLKNINQQIVSYGQWGVLIARLIPFGSFDLVNFASGLLAVRDRDFIVGTLIGGLPATLLYGLIGVNILSYKETNLVTYFAFFALVIFFTLIAVLVRINNKNAK